MGVEVPYEISERLHYLLREIRDAGAVPEEFEEEVEEILTKWDLVVEESV